MLDRLSVTWRAPLLFVLIVSGILISLACAAMWGRKWYMRAIGKHIIMQWRRVVAWNMGLRIHLSGVISSQPVLMIANHISWLDTIGIGALIPTVFVAKSDVLAWPLIGRLAQLSGTEFIDRRSRLALRNANGVIAQRIQAGDNVVFFAEGTTTDGSQVLPFKAGVFQAAIEHRLPVQTLTLRYVRNGQSDTIAPFIGDDGFVPHLLRVMAAGTTHLHLHLNQPFTALIPNRHELATLCHAQVQQQIVRLPRATDASQPLQGRAYDTHQNLNA